MRAILENLAAVDKDERYRFVEGDICDARAVDSLLTDGEARRHRALRG